jgi:hypothetical protein
MIEQRKTGTREWAAYSKNLFIGCKHDCRYCYARERALRLCLIASPAEWPVMRRNKSVLMAAKYDGRIMFPTTHDIFPEHLEITIIALKQWLAAGNDILIVTKPHLTVIQELCAALTDYKKQIVFRFTIGSVSNKTLSFWEPGAPSFEERHAALAFAFHAGYQTSVSCEPYLGLSIIDLVFCLSPLVTDTIWIGTMNDIKRRVNTSGWTLEEVNFLDMVYCVSTPDYIWQIYRTFLKHPKVHWKDSIKKVLGLPEEEIG